MAQGRREKSRVLPGHCMICRRVACTYQQGEKKVTFYKIGSTSRRELFLFSASLVIEQIEKSLSALVYSGLIAKETQILQHAYISRILKGRSSLISSIIRYRVGTGPNCQCCARKDQISFVRCPIHVDGHVIYAWMKGTFVGRMIIRPLVLVAPVR